jgi:hypothetical protein
MAETKQQEFASQHVMAGGSEENATNDFQMTEGQWNTKQNGACDARMRRRYVHSTSSRL